MSLPTCKIEVAIHDPALAPVTWIDISADVRLTTGITIKRGRDDQYSVVQTGALSFVLNNTSGKYTPENPSSTYYPDWDIGPAVRVTFTEDNYAHAYPRYYGFIDTLTVGWDDGTGNLANCMVTCVDLLAILSRAEVPDDIVSLTWLPDSPDDYWRLDEPSTARTVHNSGLNPQFNLGKAGIFDVRYDSVTFGNDGGSPVDGTGCVTSSNNGMLQDSVISGQGLGGTGSVSIEGIFTFNVKTGGACRFLPLTLLTSAFDDISIQIDYNNPLTSTLNASLVVAPGGVPSAKIYDSAGQSLNDGQPHQFDLVYVTGGSSILLYIDGRQAVGYAAAAVNWNFTTLQVGPASNNASGSPIDTMDMSRVATYRKVLTPTQVATHANAALYGFEGDDSVTRMTRYATLFGTALTCSGVAGTKALAAINDIKGAQYLDLMQDVQATENGVLYVDTSGVLNLLTRLQLYNQAASLTLPQDSYGADLSIVKDRTNLTNDATVTGSDSIVSGTKAVPQEFVNTASQAKVGHIPTSASQLSIHDSDAMAYAQWLVGTGKPRNRSPQVSIDLMTQQAILPALLAAYWATDLAQKIVLQTLPAASPVGTMNLLAQGISETLTDTDYDATISTSSADQWIAWILQDGTFGVLDSTTGLAY